jgi:membrane dipeptidase
MRLTWPILHSVHAAASDNTTVEIDGFPASKHVTPTATHFILAAEPGCCPGCYPSDRAASVEVFSAAPLPLRGRLLRLTGTWRVQADHPEGWRYRLVNARPRQPVGWETVSRRSVLTAGPLMCLAARAGANSPEAVVQCQADAQVAINSAPSIDLHSHAGHILGKRTVLQGGPFVPVAEPMRKGGMAVICHAIVADSPATRLENQGIIRAYRTPDPGELYQYSQLSFTRLHALIREQGLAIIKTAADLRAARAGRPSSIIASEGADWLEGQIDRVDEAHDKWLLRHLQLTHYRPNELGDIQTEPAVYGGLTDFGVQVVRRCNSIGVVVDVAHGTYDLVKRAASVTTKPLILSHTSLIGGGRPPRAYTRLITPDHARVIASTGGVVGVWPPMSYVGSLPGLATAMAHMVDAVGIDHVGLGSDMEGLPGPSVFPDYEHLPELAQALLGVGFHVPETVKLLGGNYARVFETALA